MVINVIYHTRYLKFNIWQQFLMKSKGSDRRITMVYFIEISFNLIHALILFRHHLVCLPPWSAKISVLACLIAFDTVLLIWVPLFSRKNFLLFYFYRTTLLREFDQGTLKLSGIRYIILQIWITSFDTIIFLITYLDY